VLSSADCRTPRLPTECNCIFGTKDRRTIIPTEIQPRRGHGGISVFADVMRVTDTAPPSRNSLVHSWQCLLAEEVSMLSHMLRFFRLVLAMTAFWLLTSNFAMGQTKPDFSGTWKDIASTSTSGCTEGIQQRDTLLKVVVDTKLGGGALLSSLTAEHTYTIGGKEEIKKTDDGIIHAVSVKWEGTSLVFLRTDQEGANTTTTREVWSLSENGKTLTVTRHITSWRGTSDGKTVFEKQ